MVPKPKAIPPVTCVPLGPAPAWSAGIATMSPATATPVETIVVNHASPLVLTQPHVKATLATRARAIAIRACRICIDGPTMLVRPVVGSCPKFTFDLAAVLPGHGGDRFDQACSKRSSKPLRHHSRFLEEGAPGGTRDPAAVAATRRADPGSADRRR